MIGQPIDQSIKLVNWYRLVLVNRWSIDNHTKIVHRLASIGTGPRDRRHARYLSDHPPFLGSPGDKIGKTIPNQSSQCKEYTPLHVYSNYPLARHCLSVSLCLRKKSWKRLYWIEGASSKAIIFAVLKWTLGTFSITFFMGNCKLQTVKCHVTTALQSRLNRRKGFQQ